MNLKVKKKEVVIYKGLQYFFSPAVGSNISKENVFVILSNAENKNLIFNPDLWVYDFTWCQF